VTALLLHTALSVVLIAWAFVVTAYIPFRPAWIWTGTALVVLIGYVSLLAKSVFEGGPVRVQVIVGNAGATLMVLAAVASLALFAVVSRGPRQAIAARGIDQVDDVDVSPRNEEPVIVPDDGDGWSSAPVNGFGSVPSGPGAEDGPRNGRHAYSSPDEDVGEQTTPRRALP
jgi:hypothetical protein